VVVRDAQGNPLPGQVVVFSVSSGESTNPSSSTTNVDGEAITQFRSPTAGAKTITALAAGLTLRATVSFGSGAPSTGPSTLTASPTSLLADGTQSTLLTVTLRDDAGNPVPDAGVSFSATGSANRFTPEPPSGRSDVSGVITARLSSTVAETKTVFATTSTFTLSTPVTFTIGPPSQANSRFSAGPQQVLANGTDTATMTVVVRDAQGNPVPGQAVTFSATGAANTITPLTATTNASGSASSSLRSTRAELKTLTATFAGLSLQTTVSFLPGPPSQARSSLVVSPTRFTTDDPGTTITVTIRDAFDNPLQGRTVDLTASGSNNQWSIFPPSGETDVNGTFVDQLTVRSSGTQTISAMCETLSMSTTITVDPGVPALGQVLAQPSELRADGVQSTLITFTVTDWNFNPIPNYPVTLSSDGSGNNWLDLTQGNTNAQGQFSARLTSTEAEWKMVSGRAGSIIRFATVVFNP
jgi:adhesin/invasin